MTLNFRLKELEADDISPENSYENKKERRRRMSIEESKLQRTRTNSEDVEAYLENGKELTGIALKNHSGWKELLIRCSENNFFGITEELVQQLLNNEQ